MANETISMLTIAVTEMAKAKAFYAEQLGFHVTRDFGEGEQHWVSLELPGGGTSLNLTTMHENMQPGTMKFYLATANLEAAYNDLKAKGIEPTGEIANDGWSKWFEISDPDGNRWLLTQA